MHCYRYTEFDPGCARMVDEPAEYRWSSYRANGLGVGSSLLTPHPEYLTLGDSSSRLANYRALFFAHIENEPATDIRRVTDRGLALGDTGFIKEITERPTGWRLRPGRIGRPPKDDRESGAAGSLF